MSLKKLSNITPAELKSKGVVSLADKPNAAASYGVGGLSPTALKLWFDQLSKLLADKINAIQDALSGDQAAEYIKLILTGLDDSNESGEYSLQDLCDAFKDGKFAEYLQLYGSAAAENLSSLQAIVNAFALDKKKKPQTQRKKRRRPPKTTGSPQQRLSIRRERAGRPRRRARGRRQFLPCKRGVTCGRGLHSLLQAAVRLCSILSAKSVRGATTFTVLSSGTAI